MSAIQAYVEKKISVQNAAAMCKLPLSDFMDFLSHLGIGSQLEVDNILTVYDFLKKLK